MSPIEIVILVAAGVFVLILLLMIGQYFSLWVQALIAGTPVRMLDLIMMRLRKMDPARIVYCLISSRKAGLLISCSDLEIHSLAGGDVSKVVQALIAARQTGIDLSWEQAAAIDLSGRDVLDTVRSSIDRMKR